MDQKENAGHHAITREAVRLFFAATPKDGDGKIDGMNELEYYQALDKAQEYMDRATGPTTHPANWDPDAQREHFMADMTHSAQQNLETDRADIEGEMMAAHNSTTTADRMTHLGAAAHPLEDSYSEAHTFRGPAVNSGDPAAPIESINVFLPQPHIDAAGHVKGKFISDEQGTHDERFDAVPVSPEMNLDVEQLPGPVGLPRGSDRAAAQAVAEMLGTEHAHRTDDAATAAQAHDATVGRFTQAAAGGVTVNANEADPAWIAERDRRLAVHDQETGAAYTPAPAPTAAPSAPPPPSPPPAPAPAAVALCGYGPCAECAQNGLEAACSQHAGHEQNWHTCASGHSWY